MLIKINWRINRAVKVASSAIIKILYFSKTPAQNHLPVSVGSSIITTFI